VFPWVAHTIQYDNGNVDKCRTSYDEPGEGLLSYFQIPSNTFRIKSINIYGENVDFYMAGCVAIEERSFTLRIWDKKLSKELYSQSYPYNLFTTKPTWVKVPVPDLRVDSDFYVEVVPNTEHEPGKDNVLRGLYVGLDLSATEGNADIIFNGVVQPWPSDIGAKEKAAWMVRVEGERGPNLERYTLSYDDGISEAGHCTSEHSYLVHFSPPLQPFRITQVLIYSWIRSDSLTDYQDREFTAKVYSETGEELWNQDFPWQLFDKDSAKWVEIDVPSVAVDDDFYVEVTTYSTTTTRLPIGYDASTPNEHSDMSLNGKIVPWKPWTWEGMEYTREKVNWMIRVKGTTLED
jgi:hypothetical protein